MTLRPALLGILALASAIPAWAAEEPSGWVDVVQDGHFLKPRAFSGATDCDGIRKTVKYEMSASPFVLQISGIQSNSISVAILPSD